MAQLASLTGASLDWLLTGETVRGQATSGPHADGELLGRLLDLLTRVYADSGITMSPLELGRIASEEHNAAADATQDEWPTLLRAAERRHRDRIAADTATRRTTKQGA